MWAGDLVSICFVIGVTSRCCYCAYCGCGCGCCCSLVKLVGPCVDLPYGFILVFKIPVFVSKSALKLTVWNTSGKEHMFDSVEFLHVRASCQRALAGRCYNLKPFMHKNFQTRYICSMQSIAEAATHSLSKQPNTQA